ncbi:iron-containing alcohol dehydrogenase [Salidesulfovibrio brasiliensis]
MQFTFNIPTRIEFGPGKLEELGTTEHLPEGKKAMIVIGESGVMLKMGYLSRVQGLLSKHGVASIVYDKIQPNPVSDHVAEAAAICREEAVDFVVGLGGGSTIDASKSIALMAANEGEYWDYMHGGTGKVKTPEKAALPIVAIPTTAGTGTEADPWTVITKSGSDEKIGWGNQSTFPKLSIVDPELMLSVPQNQTAFTGMDAFFHAVECYLATVHQPTSDLLALEAVHLITHYLPLAVEEGKDIEARTALAWASTAAGMCESLSSCISHHSLEHALSGFHPELPHGAGLILLSKAYFGFLAEKDNDRLEDLGLTMADSMGMEPQNEGPMCFVEMLGELIDNIGMGDMKLSDFGVKREEIPALAENAIATMGGLFEITPYEMTREDVIRIYEDAYA